MTEKETIILNADQIENTINRIAWQLYEDNSYEKEIIMAGINGNGFILAEKISHVLRDISNIDICLTEIKINKSEPFDHAISIGLQQEDYQDKVIILIDDVLNSGETMIYGLKHFLNVSLKKINTVVLVDRNHNRFPIKADYVGKRLSTSILEHVTVDFGTDSPYAVLS